jgi:FkbM family methyltransferase
VERQLIRSIAESAPADHLRVLRRGVRTLRGRDVHSGARILRRSVLLGSRYGGWSVLPDLLGSESIVYGFGVGEDISWDAAMIDRFGVTVHAFDPTPRSVAWIRRQQLPARFVFHEIGLADFDGEASFVMRNPTPGWSSFDLANTTGVESPSFGIARGLVARLETIAQKLGHKHVDVLKLDIEGAEYVVLPDMLMGKILPEQLLVEFHYSDGSANRLAQTAALIQKLNEVGYRLFARSPVGHEFSFVLPDTHRSAIAPRPL